MPRTSLRILMCAAAAVALATFGTLAQATFYGGDFDPPTITGHFTGHFIVNDVNDQCLADSEGCEIDLISLVITNSGDFGHGDFSTGQTNIASSVSFVGGLHFLSVPVPLTSPFSDFAFAGFSGPAAVNCSPCVQFTPDIGNDFAGHHGFLANLGFFDSNNVFTSGDTAIYVAARIPEPGSLGLLVGGIGAAWLTRRRKTRA
ncbi:MAG TPA: PEP-CTERM sorting domain-containing protein [Casimicrobiaceae bacterium]